jgi:hypothetical protein
VVLAAGGEPVRGGAEGLAEGTPPEGWRVTLGIGFVTAVDHEGGTFGGGAGMRLGVGAGVGGLSGRVVAAEMLGRGVIWADIGLSGRGGRLMRRVSRFGAFGSEGRGGSAESAMDMLFIVIPGNVQWRSW